MVYSTAVGVFRLLSGAGKVLEMPGKKVEINLDCVRQLREEGLSIVEVAKHLGVSRDVVVKRCMENGIVYGKGKSPANKRANHDISRRRMGNPSNLPRVPLEEREAIFVERFASDPRTQMYEYIGGYKAKREKLTVRCRKCGATKETTPDQLFSNKYDHHVCFNCMRIEREKNREERLHAWKEHEAAEYSKDKICETCGRVYHSTSDMSKYCSKKCKKKARDKTHRGRARNFGVEYDPSITWQTLSAELGHCNCQICGEPCDPNDTSWNGTFGPLYPTVDCIVAMKNGGGYVRGNVQLAHAICNSAKRDLEDPDDIAEAVSKHAPNDGGNAKWEPDRPTANARARHSGIDRRGRRVPQHGPARQAVPRDDSRDLRVGSGKR